jgi:hypothetical protein
MALTLTLSRREREPQKRLRNSSLSLWERVGVRVIKSLTPPIVARSELVVDSWNSLVTSSFSLGRMR